MEIRHLRLLRDLRDYGGVVAAAEATFRSPSAVSQQLRTAERDLGVALSVPEGRGIRLTEAALLLADGAEEVETALAGVQARLDAFRGGPSGTVRVATVPSAGEYLLPGVLASLRESAIRLQCTDVDVSEADFALLARDHDIVIGHSLSGQVPHGSDGLVRTVVCREPIDVALPSDHELAGREALTAADVADLPWVRVPPGYPFGTVLDRVAERTGRELSVVQEARDNRLIEAFVGAGLGVALLPRFTTRESDRVVLRPLVDVDAERWVVAMSRPDRAARAAVIEVVRQLQVAGSRAR